MAGFRFNLPFIRRKKPGFSAPLSPEQPFVAIGDVHGRFDLLEKLLQQIDAISPDLPKVLVGDILDRGPRSAEVLRRVMKMCVETPETLICLKGNHEAMCIDFIDAPAQAGRPWLRNGGDETLHSFGIDPLDDPQDTEALKATRDALVNAMGDEMIAWLRHLPLIWRSGNVVVTHAGGDPSQPIEPRRGHGLLWGHPDFLRKPRQDGLWIVHGHIVMPEAKAEMGRISIDTGAYSTERLSAAIIDGQTPRFLHT